MNRAFSLRLLPLGAVLLMAGSGCHYFRDLNSGTHLDAPRDRAHDSEPNRVREMLVDVTTDASGNVAEIHFQRSSGKEGVDAYVAQSIKEGWPRQPSTKSVASLTYSEAKGFTSPKVLSSTPVPVP